MSARSDLLQAVSVVSSAVTIVEVGVEIVGEGEGDVRIAIGVDC